MPHPPPFFPRYNPEKKGNHNTVHTRTSLSLYLQTMERIEKHIEVPAPLRAVYNQWTQFEDFPKFMEGVKEVRQLNDKRLFWRAEILGQDIEWEAEIYEQVPNTRIAWRSV